MMHPWGKYNEFPVGTGGGGGGGEFPLKPCILDGCDKSLSMSSA